MMTVRRYEEPEHLLFDQDRRPILIRGLYRGVPAFLVLSGPSLARHNLERLNARGALVMAVNNAAVADPMVEAGVRADLWTCWDQPGNFCDQIWLDPRTLKIVPSSHWDEPLEVASGSGFDTSRTLVKDCPNVLAYLRGDDFWPDTFLYGNHVLAGNRGKLQDNLGHSGHRSVLFVAFRLLFWLGVRTVFLLGADFKMALGERNYAFDQDRSEKSVDGNNKKYKALSDRLEALKPYFAAENFNVFNCTAGGALGVFPRMTFAEAVERSTAACAGTIITNGRYDRG